MSTHEIILVVQYLTITVLFIELAIIFVKWNSSMHSFLFWECIASFVNNLGYLFEIKARSEEAYLTALKLSYAGRVWIGLAFFLFAAKMCRRRIPRALSWFLITLHIGIYASVLSVGRSDLFYSSCRFVPDPVFPQFQHTNGVLHDLFILLNLSYILISMIWILISLRRERSRSGRYRFIMLFLAVAVQAASLLLHQITVASGVSNYYDLTMPGTLIANIFLLIGIFGFDLLGTKEIARDFVIDRISEGIIAVDNEGRIQYYNEPAAKLYPEFDILFKTGPIKTGRKSSKTAYDIVDAIDGAVREGETLKIDDRIFTPEKNELLYKGESYGKLYALMDDTEHYLYMEELQKQRDIADSANEAKSRFLANMSHEIRTPINAVLGMDEMILRESKEKTIRSYAGNIMSAGRSLLSLINDILDLSKVEEGKMEIIPVQYDLTTLLGDLIQLTRERAEKKGLNLLVKVDSHTPHLLFGDEIRIKQCATNLLTNAVKYTEKGEVTLEVSFEEKDKEHLFLRVTVRDTGIGMRAEDMESLFSPYKRIEEKRNRTIEGTGLGMSITRQLLELMGSSLSVESEYGKGSIFSFSVEQGIVKWEEIGEAAGRLDKLSDDSYEYHALFHAPEARILVIDDTEMNLTVIKSLLKRTGIGIDTASSGKEGLGLAAEQCYDVIFIDHMMPDMDGIETLRHIRETGASAKTPAVALTANAVSGAREMYLNAGFSNYLSKPVDGKQLEEMLAGLLPPEKLQEGEDTEAPEIDEQAGLENCGSVKGYLSVLSVFRQTAPAKAEEIEEFYRKGDLPNYTIRVHALKSSARIIGAGALSELAAALEAAGKREDTAFIDQNTDRLLTMYREVNHSLSWLDPPEESKPEIRESALTEAYQTMAEIASGMDYGMMEELLKSLKSYRLPPPEKKRVDELEGMLTELDWDGMMRVLETVLKERS